MAIIPNATQENGIITIQLTWDHQPDLDLHVYEPGYDDPSLNIRGHVYFANPQGKFGYLDVDDVNQYGPEHYYASYDNLI